MAIRGQIKAVLVKIRSIMRPCWLFFGDFSVFLMIFSYINDSDVKHITFIYHYDNHIHNSLH